MISAAFLQLKAKATGKLRERESSSCEILRRLAIKNVALTVLTSNTCHDEKHIHNCQLLSRLHKNVYFYIQPGRKVVRLRAHFLLCHEKEHFLSLQFEP